MGCLSFDVRYVKPVLSGNVKLAMPSKLEANIKLKTTGFQANVSNYFINLKSIISLICRVREAHTVFETLDGDFMLNDNKVFKVIKDGLPQ